MRASIDKILNFEGAGSITWPDYGNLTNDDDKNVKGMTKHGIHSTDENITVEYRVGSIDAPLQTLAVNPDAPNGWADGAIWNQCLVTQYVITATTACTVSISSFTDKDV